MESLPTLGSEEEYLISKHPSFHILAPKPSIIAAALVIIALVSLLAVSTAYLKYQEIQSMYRSTSVVPIAASSPATDTSGWKTYRNAKYGFEFKYPSEGIILSDDDFPPTGHLLEIRLEEGGDGKDFILKKIMVLTEIGQRINSCTVNISSGQKPVDTKTIGGKIFTNWGDFSFFQVGGIKDMGTLYQIFHDNICRSILLEDYGKHGKLSSEIWGQILSTFKFTK